MILSSMTRRHFSERPPVFAHLHSHPTLMKPLILEKKRSILYLCILSLSLLLLSYFSLFRSNPPHSPLSPPFLSPPCNPKTSRFLKVYMYDLPPKFHFGLLDWKPNDNEIFPDILTPSSLPLYPGGLTLQHSAEYYLTLDLLSSPYRCSAVIRERNSSAADIIFVPFFSSLSYNRYAKLRHGETPNQDLLLQEQLAQFLLSRDEWKRNGGRDHVIVAHHPNSISEARKKLSSAVFILADFARYPPDIANLAKDIVAPYKHIIDYPPGNYPPFQSRRMLVYFRGAIRRKDGGAVREQLYQLLRGEREVYFSYGTAKGRGARSAGKGMAAAKFCLHIAGDTPSSNRLFDAIACGCVPVIVSDDIELPFEDEIDFGEFCFFVRGEDAVKEGFLLGFLRSVEEQEWRKMREKMKEIAGSFEYRFPSKEGDAVQMIWAALARKRPNMRLSIHRAARFRRSSGEREMELMINSSVV